MSKTETVTKTIKFPLRHSRRKKDLLLATVEESQRVARVVAERMPSISSDRWKKSTDSVYYNWVRDLRHGIYAQCCQEVVDKVRSAFASWKSNGYRGDRPRFGSGMWARWHNQSVDIFESDGTYYLRVPTVRNGNGRGYVRTTFPFVPSDYTHYFLGRLMDGELDYGAVEIHYSNDGGNNDGGGFVAHIPVKREVEVDKRVDTFVGVDLGLRNIAVMVAVDAVSRDVAGGSVEMWSGREAGDIRDRFYRLRRELGEKGLVSKIKDSKGREERWMDNFNHNISREIIDRAGDLVNPAICMEELRYIRDRIQSNNMNRMLHSWRFRRLQDMIEYKAQEKGMPVIYVNPRNTSKRCNKCGYVDRKNREGGSPIFHCQNCGYEVNADVNGAINISLGGFTDAM